MPSRDRWWLGPRMNLDPGRSHTRCRGCRRPGGPAGNSPDRQVGEQESHTRSLEAWKADTALAATCRSSGPRIPFDCRMNPDLTVGAISWRPSGPPAETCGRSNRQFTSCALLVVIAWIGISAAVSVACAAEPDRSPVDL